MKLIKKLLIITGVFIVVITVVIILSIIGIPMGSSNDKMETMSIKNSDNQITSQLVHRNSLHLLSPEGPFNLHRWDYICYYELKGDKKTKLEFFTNYENENKLLEPIFPIYNSDKWAAFRLLESEVKYETVSLLMYIFDSKQIYHIFKVENVIRIYSGECEHFYNVCSYSVSQSQANGRITINTLDGLVTYDQISDKLIINKVPRKINNEECH